MVTIVLRRDFAIGHVPIHFPKVPVFLVTEIPGSQVEGTFCDCVRERPVMNTQIQLVQGSVWDKHVRFRELEDYMANLLIARIVKSSKCWIVCRHIWYIHKRSITSKSRIFLGFFTDFFSMATVMSPYDHEASSFVDISPQRLYWLLVTLRLSFQGLSSFHSEAKKISKNTVVYDAKWAAPVAATVGNSEKNLHLHLPCYVSNIYFSPNNHVRKKTTNQGLSTSKMMVFFTIGSFFNWLPWLCKGLMLIL